MKRIFKYGSKKIEYNLEFGDRKTLRISVMPELQVNVIAPLGTPRRRVDEILNKRGPWILKQQELFLAFFPKQPPKRYIAGETHRYLGKSYRLKIHLCKRESVKLSGKFILVECRKKRDVKSLLSMWHNNRASSRFIHYAGKWIEHFKKYNVTPKEIVLKEMPKRWGSCTPKGKIILNPDLVKAPRECIEYVIVHELCHLVYRNHSIHFLNLQKKTLPNWEMLKTRLEKLLA